MSEVQPAGENDPLQLSPCDRVALAAVGPPVADEAFRSAWADVIALGDDRVGLVVVSTAPRTVPAVGLRHIVAEVLGDGGTPAVALEALAQCLARQPGPLLDGAASCAVLDGAAGTLLWSAAGPSAPLVVNPAGGWALTGGQGPSLAQAERPFPQAEETLEAGATVILQTREAHDDLTPSAARHHDLAPDDLAAALLADAGAGTTPVLLLARLIPAPLAERLPADPRRLPGLRRRIGTWSAQAALSDDTAADLQLLLSEAATNSVEHAYRDIPPGEFVYSVRRRADGAIRVEVQDFGRWRPPPADPGYRGRGLAVIHKLADEVTLEVGDTGTRVAFTVPADPPPLAERRADAGATQWWTAGTGDAR